MQLDYIEYLGYVGSVLVAASLLMSSMRLLRSINLLGSLCFVVYGFSIQATPIIIINCFSVVVNTYHIFKMAKKKRKIRLA